MSEWSPISSMERALRLAAAAKGRTSPNPAVGCVVVAQGEVVGEGFTQPPGGPHAEIVALRAAGTRADCGELYVTLEPCAHQGRTPPCTEAIIAAGIIAVHCATLDPNPMVSGRGVRALRAAGLRVTVGEMAAYARLLNEDFARSIRAGVPYVTTKFAMSLDGKIATRTGESHYITGSEARLRVHRLRDQVDAILVGVGTVVADNPALTTRLPESTNADRAAADTGIPVTEAPPSRVQLSPPSSSHPAPHTPPRPVRHPWRIIADSRLRAPLSAQVFDPTLPGRTAVLTTAAAPPERIAVLRKRAVEVVVLPDDGGRVDLHAALELLARRQVMHLLVESGSTLLGSLFDGDLVDRVLAFVAPVLVGGASAPGPIGGSGVAKLARARRLKDVRVEQVGEDLLVEGYTRRVDWPETGEP